MFGLLARKIFGSVNDRRLKKIQPLIARINTLSEAYAKLSDAELQAHTEKFKERIAKGEGLDSILPEAFATVREASNRVLKMRHFDVQLIGGIILHKGMISEMKTGEGKTLVATLPVYLNALTGKGVHVVTVNDYLAERDANWMGQLYNFLGLSVGCIVHGISDEERKQAYDADITYGTNNEFGFDFLRDNLKFDISEMVQREFHYAIVDEVDSILIDEARTPLIISGPTDDSSELYKAVNKAIANVKPNDYEIDEKNKNIFLTDEGSQNAEKLLKNYGLMRSESGLYEFENMSLLHHFNQALKAHKLFKKDTDYIVKEGKVMIIDEFTGRIMEGRRYSDGLHQALEAKEGVKVQQENQTLASITFQNYFRMYPKLAGMTGTAMTEAGEFSEIYNLEVVEIPTHKPIARKDENDEIYKTEKEKYSAIIEEIVKAHGKGQPVLVGTISIEKSEHLSSLLKRKKIKHNVLNAKYHAQEAEIIAQAGRPGAITIATNMAGRGTDIKLGGNEDILYQEKKSKQDKEKAYQKAKEQVEKDQEKVREAGGLLVIGTERHESRRIDNQLRGRSGRQGDPGRTKFYLSLEDDLMRIFGSDKLGNLLSKLGLKEGEAIIHPWINRALAKAQQKVEARNFEIRKNLLKFDNVMNDQRQVIYQQRLEVMKSKDISSMITEMRKDINSNLVAKYIPAKALPEEWDVENLQKELTRIYSSDFDIRSYVSREGVSNPEILEHINKASEQHFAEKESAYGAEIIRQAESRVLLITLDHLWKEHLHHLDHLRTGINLRAYGQKDPLNEYKFEAFRMFQNMLEELQIQTIQRLAHIAITSDIAERPVKKDSKMVETREQLGNFDERPSLTSPFRSYVAPEERDPKDPSSWGKVARNEPCPCGSGVKYKYCHGAIV